MPTSTRKAHREIRFQNARWHVILDGLTLGFRRFRGRKTYRLSLQDLCASASGQLHLPLSPPRGRPLVEVLADVPPT